MPDVFYALPVLVAGTAVVVLFVALALGGMLVTRRWLNPRLTFSSDSNTVVGGIVQSIGVFYGVTIGLIAISAWTNYNSVGNAASQEAAAIGVLYRSVSSYPEPNSSSLQSGLRAYTENVINEDWPAQARGEIAESGTFLLNDFQRQLASFEPITEGQKILHAETLSAYNHLIELRRQRVDTVDTSLETSMWVIIWLGAAISLMIMYFFNLPDVYMHAALIGLSAAFIGLLVVVIAVNDRPYAGSVAVSPQSYQIIIETVMDKVD